MKTKSFSNKLKFGKETIAKLNVNELVYVNGGGSDCTYTRPAPHGDCSLTEDYTFCALYCSQQICP
jgi:hypothetical protein